MRSKKYNELLKLKGKITEKKKNYREISREVGLSLSAFNDKMNGYSAFDIVEAAKIAKILEIPTEEIPYFFA